MLRLVSTLPLSPPSFSSLFLLTLHLLFPHSFPSLLPLLPFLANVSCWICSCQTDKHPQLSASSFLQLFPTYYAICVLCTLLQMLAPPPTCHHPLSDICMCCKAASRLLPRRPRHKLLLTCSVGFYCENCLGLTFNTFGYPPSPLPLSFLIILSSCVCN